MSRDGSGLMTWILGPCSGPSRGSTPLPSLAFSPDGKRVVSGSEGGLVQIWDIETGKEVVPRPGHTQAVHAVAAAKDGRVVVTGGADKTVRLWNLASDPPGQEGKRMDGHTGTVTEVMVLPDQKQARSRSDDGSVRFWGLGTGKEDRRITVPKMVGISPDSRLVVTCPDNNTLAVIDSETGNDSERVTSGNLQAREGRFSSDGLWWATTGTDHLVELWSRKGKPPVRRSPPLGAFRVSRGFEFSPTSRFLLAGYDDGAVRMFDVDKFDQVQPRTFAGLVTAITGVAWAADEKAVAASSDKGKVVVWETDSGKVLGEWQMPGAVHGVAFLPDGRHLLTANGNGTAFVLRLKSSPSAGSP
jgi:WD40 repeat protein